MTRSGSVVVKEPKRLGGGGSRQTSGATKQSTADFGQVSQAAASKHLRIVTSHSQLPLQFPLQKACLMGSICSKEKNFPGGGHTVLSDVDTNATRQPPAERRPAVAQSAPKPTPTTSSPNARETAAAAAERRLQEASI